MNRGIMLLVSRAFTAAELMTWLPPDHRIVAVRPRADCRGDDWLIEGPGMPPVPPSGMPDEVAILVTATRGAAIETVRQDGQWQHKRAGYWHSAGPSWRMPDLTMAAPGEPWNTQSLAPNWC